MSRSRKTLSYQTKKNISYTMFLIPFLIGFFVLFLGIYFSSVRLSFSSVEMKGAEGFAMHFVKWDNYRFLFKEDPTFMGEVRTSIGEMMFNVVTVTLYSLLMAIILNTKLKGRALFRAIFFIPVILATGFVDKADTFVSIMNQQMGSLGASANDSAGAANGLISAFELEYILRNLNFSPFLTGFIERAVTNVFNIVNLSGVQMMIFLAGLQSISPAIYEAAEVDGSSRWESFWLITFPMISPIILVNVIYTIVDSLTKPKNIIMQRIDAMRKLQNGMGTAAAMSWFYFLLIAVCIALVTLILRSYIYYQQRD